MMDLGEVVQDVIYYFEYFKIADTTDKQLLAQVIALRLESLEFVEMLLERLIEEKRMKAFINAKDRKRLKALLIGLENIRVMILLDHVLENKAYQSVD